MTSYIYTCPQCRLKVGGRGLDKHLYSSRCDDRQQAYKLGEQAGLSEGRKEVQSEIKVALDISEEDE